MSKNNSTTLVYMLVAVCSIYFLSSGLSGKGFILQTASIDGALSSIEATTDASLLESDRTPSDVVVDPNLDSGDLVQIILNNDVDIETQEVETDPTLGASQYVQIDAEETEEAPLEPTIDSVEVTEEETQPEAEVVPVDTQIPKTANIYTFDVEQDQASKIDFFLSKRQKIRTFSLGGNIYAYFLTAQPSRVTLNIKDALGNINNTEENKLLFGGDVYSLSHFIKIDSAYLSKDGKNQINIIARTSNKNSYTQVIFFDYSEY